MIIIITTSVNDVSKELTQKENRNKLKERTINDILPKSTSRQRLEEESAEKLDWPLQRPYEKKTKTCYKVTSNFSLLAILNILTYNIIFSFFFRQIHSKFDFFPQRTQDVAFELLGIVIKFHTLRDTNMADTQIWQGL